MNEKIKLYKSLYAWQIKSLTNVLGFDLFEDLTQEQIAEYDSENEKRRRMKISAGMQNKKAVLQLDENGKIINHFESTGEASRQTGISTPKCIAKCCRGERKQVGGFIWKYDDRKNY